MTTNRKTPRKTRTKPKLTRRPRIGKAREYCPVRMDKPIHADIMRWSGDDDCSFTVFIERWHAQEKVSRGEA